MTQHSDLESLGKALGAKHDEICTALAQRLGLETDLDKMSAADLGKIVTLADDIDAVLKAILQDQYPSTLEVGLQQLLINYYELRKQLRDRISTATKGLVEEGVLVDSGKRCPKTGQIKWMPNPKPTKEQQKVLAEYRRASISLVRREGESDV